MVLVFRTSAKTKSDVIKLKPEINNLAPSINWNFDLEDCDNILRIESYEVLPSQVISLFKKHQYECKELE
jgi:hypothetical protein